MSRPRLIVLKFGGSALRCETDLCRVVHEIYRWRRDGWLVLAVVSARAGRTDALLRCSSTFCDDASPHALAGRIALGEFECAAELGLYLDRAGVPAVVLSPGSANLRADGPALDAWLESSDAHVLRRALDEAGAVVVPGFAATDALGRTVVLGRGGSDLTALCLAHQLQADRCRLIKDVDGLYESDPRAGHADPRRFVEATFTDALRTDGSIIQTKAIRFARQHGRRFELSSFNSGSPTVIGSELSHFAAGSTPSRPLRVALLGLGTVGSGVYTLLGRLPDQFRVTQVVVRDPGKPRSPDVDRALLTTDLEQAAASGADIVIELIGGVDAALTAHRMALASGSHVVTANKALVAQHGNELRALAMRHNVQLHCSASVAGSIPLLERTAGRGNELVRLRAVLNGTSNYVLQRLSAGVPFDRALHEAKSRGYAEADPGRDLDGRDAADKLEVLTQFLGLHAGKVETEAMTASAERNAADAKRNGHRLRQVSELTRHGSAVQLGVSLQPCAPDDPLYDVPDARNAVELHGRDGRTEVLHGRGAGCWPTAESVMADVLSIVRQHHAGARSPGDSSCGRAPRRLTTCT